MLLVVDANEIFSALIAHGRGRSTKKTEILFSPDISLFAPEVMFEEIEKNKEGIMSEAEISEEEFVELMKSVRESVAPVSSEELLRAWDEAKRVCPHEKDIPYFAAALALGCPLWSGEERLKRQSSVQVYNTKELVEKFKL